MSKYKDLLTKIETLKAQAEEERRKEIADVVADIKQKMAEYGIKPSDLGFSGGRASKSASKGTVAPKYRDPATGKTWTGRGRAPKWVAEAESRGVSRDTFLIS
ncbi:H-NS histone family protein [Algiphilus sp.]|uniref:H-NS histone family protein n=1 Tax=Algiphilus sp. TaxID=1872431 RepID=UPI0025C6D439|nr:H-NS histone family protein [Algiphilus sp.]MCK5769239.1 H-NS histone family protein [Algiphilus sp.]